jgi:hypothetical protein
MGKRARAEEIERENIQIEEAMKVQEAGRRESKRSKEAVFERK